MARIVFVIDLEDGHLLPTFPLADSLKRANHEIVYLTFLDCEALIRKMGFDFYPLFQDHYPKGFKEIYKELVSNDDHRGFDKHLIDFSNGSFDKTLATLQGDVFIVSSFLTIEALFLHYKYNLKPVILSPRLYDVNDPLCDICASEIIILPADESMHLLDLVGTMKLKHSSFQDLVSPLATFMHLILCSKDFEKSTINHNKQTTYIGCGGLHRQSQAGWAELADRKVIYASMGSQAYMYGDKLTRLYSKLVALMSREEMKEYHLVFSMGNSDLYIRVDSPAANITLAKWVDQPAILMQSCLAIVHGGLNTIKECIYASTPMVVIPGARDQPINAERVEEHGIGTVIDIVTISGDDLMSTVLRVLKNEAYKKNLQEMRKRFETLDKLEVGVRVINSVLKNGYAEPSAT